jgi:zinc protease
MLGDKIDSFYRKKVPPIHKIVPFSLEKPFLTILFNGIKFYLFQNQSLDVIFFTLMVKSGYLFENQKFVASSCYSLLSESSGKYTSSEVEDFLDFYGSEFSASVRMDYVELNFVIPKSNCEKVLPFIFDFVAYPHFNSDNLSLYKERKIKNLEYNSMQVSYCSTQYMFKTLFNQKLPIGEILTKEHIENVTVSNLQSYHRETFCAENIRLFVSGNVDENLQGLISELFSEIKSNKPISYPDYFPKYQVPDKLVVEKREDVVQSAIMLCRRFNSYLCPDRKDFSLVSMLFGGYFGARLMKNLREKNGYTYGVYNGVLYFAGSSIYYIKSEVNVDKTKEALEKCINEMNRLSSEYVTDKELNTVKNYMLGGLLRNFDGTVSYMNNFIQWNDFGVDESELNKTIKAINQMTPQRVTELSCKYLIPDEFSTIVVGNYL